MNKKSSIRIHQEPLEFHKNKELMDPFKFQLRIPGTDIPGYGKHYPCLALKGPMGEGPGPFLGSRSGHPDPGFWNRGGGRWFHTKRRGGVMGRQRERRLPMAPFPE